MGRGRIVPGLREDTRDLQVPFVFLYTPNAGDGVGGGAAAPQREKVGCLSVRRAFQSAYQARQRRARPGAPD